MLAKTSPILELEDNNPKPLNRLTDRHSMGGTAARAGFGQGPGVFLPAKEPCLCDGSGVRGLGFGVSG